MTRPSEKRVKGGTAPHDALLLTNLVLSTMTDDDDPFENMLLPRQMEGSLTPSSCVFIGTVDNVHDPFADMLLRSRQNDTFSANVLNYNLRVCQFCMTRGYTECRHMRAQMPRWLNTPKCYNLLGDLPETDSC